MANRKRNSEHNNEREEPLPQAFKSSNRDRLRVIMPDNCLKQLDEIKNYLNLRSLGRAVDWMLPDNLMGLVELTEEMGYANGGQTIDWLLKAGMVTERIVNFKQELDSQTGGQTVNLSLSRETRPLVELTRELGFNKGGETVDWLLEMATNPMSKLINTLGFKDGGKAIEWLMIQAQSSIREARMNGLNPHKRPKISPAIEYGLNPPKQPETPQIHNFTAQPHQFQSAGQQFVETQQQARFHNNGSDPQAEYQSFDGNADFSNRSKRAKRRRKGAGHSHHGGNQLQSQYPSGHPGSQATTHIERTTANSTQGLSQNPSNGADVARVQGFQGMPLETHVQNNSVIMGNTCQQNIPRQFRIPKGLLDFYFANLDKFANIHNENQNLNQFVNIYEHNHNQNKFVNMHEQNQNQNQFVNMHEQHQNQNQNQNQFVNMHEQHQNQNQFVNMHEQHQNQNQFVNIHEQYQNRNHFVNIPEQNEFVTTHEQNQNQFVNIHERNLNQFLNTHGQNQGGTQAKGNQGGHAGLPLSNEAEIRRNR